MKPTKILFIDIETSKAPDYELFKPEFKEPKDKRSKSIEEQQISWESGLALSPLTGQVLCCGISADDEINVYQQQDQDIITINECDILGGITEQIAKADLIIGHNIKDFDLWFIYNRCRKHGITFPDKLYSKYKGRFNWNDCVIDTMDLWSCGKYKEYISLNNLAKYFGLKPKDSNISKNFEEVWNTDREKAIEHCRYDVELVKQIYNKLK